MITFYLCGDSTMANKEENKRPESGWGEHLTKLLGDQYQVLNYAKNGRSSKSFIAEGILDEISSKIKKNDYLIIQFGHNDQKKDHRYTNPESDFKEYLNIYINLALSKQAIPILLTPIARRKFADDQTIINSHGKYLNAIVELAHEKEVDLIDSYELTKNWLQQIKEEESKKYFLYLNKGENINYPEGKSDDTHLNIQGANIVAGLITVEIKKIIEVNKKILN